MLTDVQRLLKLQRRLNDSFTSLLSWQPVTEAEQNGLAEIRQTFESYYEAGKILE